MGSKRKTGNGNYEQKGMLNFPLRNLTYKITPTKEEAFKSDEKM